MSETLFNRSAKDPDEHRYDPRSFHTQIEAKDFLRSSLECPRELGSFTFIFGGNSAQERCKRGCATVSGLIKKTAGSDASHTHGEASFENMQTTCL
eukprot:2132336-Rhodomonas_salina.1